MNLCNINHSFNYELEKLCRIFLPFDKINIINEIKLDKIYAVCTIAERTATVELFISGKNYKHKAEFNSEDKKEAELALASCLYRCFNEATGYKAPWGLLTGVRPVKLYSKMLKSCGEIETDKYFKEKLLVSDEKLSLCKETAEPEQNIVNKSSRKSFSLYVSVPFCPSRCSYCSFVSHSVDKAKKLIKPYIELLCEELKVTAKIAAELSLKLETVYIGGGTPVSLEADELGQIMQTISECFDISNIYEYTVEAGRPDAITKEKLIAIKQGGATRISINPQTLNDDVLIKIGRKHTAKQTLDAFKLARELGFDNINTDLIAGLPSESFDSFKDTVDKISKLSPESVTVHSLSVKKASTLSANLELPDFENGETAASMVRYARQTFTNAGILPYYMYRQSKTVGNLENVGYSKKGYEGFYNVYIMDETHTILACGASAVTKLREPGGDLIERIYNFKYPYEYISRFDEMVKRKEKIKDFYNEHKI